MTINKYGITYFIKKYLLQLVGGCADFNNE